MKKTLFIILAGLLLVGLVGCSGILHDKGLLSGAEWDFMAFNSDWSVSEQGKKLTEVSTTEWTYELNNWKATELGIAVKVGDSWTSRYEVVVDGKFALGVKQPTQTTEPSPRAYITGLTPGGSYKITFVAENGAIFVTVEEK